MNRQQVGKRQRPIKLFLGCAQFLGVLNDGQGGGHSLIATARIDNHRQFAAIHTRVRSRGSPRLGPGPYIPAVGIQQHLADVRAIVSPQALVRHHGIVGNLPVQYIADVLQIHGIRKVAMPATDNRP